MSYYEEKKTIAIGRYIGNGPSECVAAFQESQHNENSQARSEQGSIPILNQRVPILNQSIQTKVIQGLPVIRRITLACDQMHHPCLLDHCLMKLTRCPDVPSRWRILPFLERIPPSKYSFPRTNICAVLPSPQRTVVPEMVRCCSHGLTCMGRLCSMTTQLPSTPRSSFSEVRKKSSDEESIDGRVVEAEDSREAEVALPGQEAESALLGNDAALRPLGRTFELELSEEREGALRR